MRLFYLILFFLALIMPAVAVDPSEMLNDPTLESRARGISKDLRCVVCQNQSIDDSDARLARDLRLLVRDRIMAGDSDQQVIDYVVSRYGDYVLLKPPFKGTTLVLWIGPVILILLSLFAFYSFFSRQNKTSSKTKASKPLTDEERNRLKELLKKDAS